MTAVKQPSTLERHAVFLGLHGSLCFQGGKLKIFTDYRSNVWPAPWAGYVGDDVVRGPTPLAEVQTFSGDVRLKEVYEPIHVGRLRI